MAFNNLSDSMDLIRNSHALKNLPTTFNHDAWVKGMVFDLSSKKWGEAGIIKVKKPKPKKVRKIKPAIPALAGDDINGRTIAEHGACISMIAMMVPDKEKGNCNNHYTVSTRKGTRKKNNEGVKMLTELFLNQENEDERA